jgi:hypothetical protein
MTAPGMHRGQGRQLQTEHQVSPWVLGHLQPQAATCLRCRSTDHCSLLLCCHLLHYHQCGGGGMQAGHWPSEGRLHSDMPSLQQNPGADDGDAEQCSAYIMMSSCDGLSIEWHTTFLKLDVGNSPACWSRDTPLTRTVQHSACHQLEATCGKTLNRHFKC